MTIARAGRRRLQKLHAKASRSPEDFTRFIDEAVRQSDDTNPLRYQGGFVHVGCGGEAERPSNFGAGAFCKKCDRAVPWEDTAPA